MRVLVIVAALAVSGVACEGRADRAKPPAPHGVAWRALGSWSGHGNAQTASFTSETGALRVRWETSQRPPDKQPGQGDPSFRVAAHSAISGRLLQPVVEHAGAGEGTGYVQQDPHVFFMVVESNQLDWRLTVEEAIGYP